MNRPDFVTLYNIIIIIIILELSHCYLCCHTTTINLPPSPLLGVANRTTPVATRVVWLSLSSLWGRRTTLLPTVVVRLPLTGFWKSISHFQLWWWKTGDSGVALRSIAEKKENRVQYPRSQSKLSYCHDFFSPHIYIYIYMYMYIKACSKLLVVKIRLFQE